MIAVTNGRDAQDANMSKVVIQNERKTNNC